MGFQGFSEVLVHTLGTIAVKNFSTQLIQPCLYAALYSLQMILDLLLKNLIYWKGTLYEFFEK
jgi:hypothetical protein